MTWIVELEPGVYIADINGDPGRALSIENALVFGLQDRAELALSQARYHRHFENARVVKLDQAGKIMAILEEKMNDGYDKVDRFLRNNLDDNDYSEYSESLDAACGIDSTGAAHIDRTYHWREIASDPPAPGLRVQLIHMRDGVAYYGMWREGLDATHWAALPTFEP